ncbi:MAG: PQQ-dependent sugar dehydrogenase, partial [Pseudomonadota bacterium]
MLRYALLTTTLLSLAACGGQTTAVPANAPESDFSLTPVVEELEFPWGIAVLPDGNMLVTEREGRLNLVTPTGDKTVISGAPDAFVERQGGYFGLALDPDFASNRTIYMSYAEGDARDNATAVMRAVLSEDGTALSDVTDIYRADARDTAFHFGGRLQFLPDGTLLVSLGEGFRYMEDAQDPTNTHGTLVRINSDGSIPDDNPFADGENGKAEVYSYGHRNIQGLWYDAETDTIFASEHGPKGGDEVNIIGA